MLTPLPTALTSYQRGARALSAKSASALALGAGALALAPADAHATIISFNVTSNNVVSSGNPLLFSLTTGETSNSSISGDQRSQERFFISGASGFDHIASVFGRVTNPGSTLATSPGHGEDIATFFNLGEVVSNALTFRTDGSFNGYYDNVAPAWAGVTGFAGLRFTLDDGLHYGWVKLQTNADATTITVLAMGYNTVAGQSITAGQGLAAVPEPASSAALLALGAAGLVAYRQRKKIQRAA